MRKKLTALLLVLVMVFSIQSFALAAPDGAVKNFQQFLALDFTNKIVFLHSNDVHGTIAGYAKIAYIKSQLEGKVGTGDVFLFDGGDFAQGSAYVGYNKGIDAINLMNAVGYDVATFGNHEFDYGYAQLKILAAAATSFDMVSANIYENGVAAFDDNVTLTVGSKKIGVFGITTPETYTKANPALMTGLTFDAGAAMFATAQAQVDALKTAGADFIICLGHLGIDASSAGNRSTDLLAAVTGIDLLIDGHSHTMIDGDTNTYWPYTGGSMLTSTGSGFANIGAVVYDPADGSKESYLISTADIKDSSGNVTAAFPSDPAIKTLATTITNTINAAMGVQVGISDVLLEGGALNGSSPEGGTIPNLARLQETNLGDLITDAMVWGAAEAGYPVDGAITNGGGIRKNIRIGNVTQMDIYNVLPFGNYLTIINVTGAQLIKALEASTYCTPKTIGGFPQVSGIKYTVNTAVPYAPDASPYPGSTYYGPASIRRVTIQDVGGKGFSMTATYTLAVNNFMAAGGDTYYEFKMTPNQIEVGEQVLDQTVIAYINEVLKQGEAQYGTIGSAYAAPQGRITFISVPAQVNYTPGTVVSTPPAAVPNTGDAVSAMGIVFVAAGAMLALGAVKAVRSKKRG